MGAVCPVHQTFELLFDVTFLTQTSVSAPRRSPTRPIILLAAAGFASQAQVRVTDSLLPQIAADFRTTIGIAAIVVTTYVITHGLIQFIAHTASGGIPAAPVGKSTVPPT